jgi:hypothetical protein
VDADAPSTSDAIEEDDDSSEAEEEEEDSFGACIRKDSTEWLRVQPS